VEIGEKIFVDTYSNQGFRSKLQVTSYNFSHELDKKLEEVNCVNFQVFEEV
jgi:hypothetical protein